LFTSALPEAKKSVGDTVIVVFAPSSVSAIALLAISSGNRLRKVGPDDGSTAAVLNASPRSFRSSSLTGTASRRRNWL
jgi:hypothetical protein